MRTTGDSPFRLNWNGWRLKLNMFGNSFKVVKNIDGGEQPELRENIGINPLKNTFVMETFMLQVERNILLCSQICQTG